LITALILSAAIVAGQTAQLRRESDVPFVPTTGDAIQSMLKLANVKQPDLVYDIGCGDGRIVMAAAKEYAQGVAIDINPQRIQEAKENARKGEVENLVSFEENDLFQADIHEASVVTLFLQESVNMRLHPKLLNDLKPGTRIVSNTFDMGDWKPDKELKVGDGSEEFMLSHKLYLWTVPVRPSR
jgi:precorrin-6B methylase 2